MLEATWSHRLISLAPSLPKIALFPASVIVIVRVLTSLGPGTVDAPELLTFLTFSAIELASLLR
eukprot:6917433-Lingulodinium_polyedra.AAC.1